MCIPAEQIATLGSLGYTEPETGFLYLVATHAGYFARREFLTLTAKSKGWSVHQFAAKVLDRGYAHAVEYRRQTYVYNLYSLRVYDSIGKTNLRNRRGLSKLAVQTRLLILDFVLAHVEEGYLETEADRVTYLHDSLKLPLSRLPARIHRGANSSSCTTRYFLDRVPIYLPRPGNASSASGDFHLLRHRPPRPIRLRQLPPQRPRLLAPSARQDLSRRSGVVPGHGHLCRCRLCWLAASLNCSSAC